MLEVPMVTKDNKEVIVIDETTIKSKIYHIRNQKVMLDFDIAKIDIKFGRSSKATICFYRASNLYAYDCINGRACN